MANDAAEFHPTAVLYEDKLSASIYRSTGRHGPTYSVEFYRSGYCDGVFVTTKRFRTEHLLQLQHLARRSYDHIRLLQAREEQFRLCRNTPS